YGFVNGDGTVPLISAHLGRAGTSPPGVTPYSLCGLAHLQETEDSDTQGHIRAFLDETGDITGLRTEQDGPCHFHTPGVDALGNGDIVVADAQAGATAFRRAGSAASSPQPAISLADAKQAGLIAVHSTGSRLSLVALTPNPLTIRLSTQRGRPLAFRIPEVDDSEVRTTRY